MPTGELDLLGVIMLLICTACAVYLILHLITVLSSPAQPRAQRTQNRGQRQSYQPQTSSAPSGGFGEETDIDGTPLSPAEQEIYGIPENKYAPACSVSDLALHEAAHVVAYLKQGGEVSKAWIKDPSGSPPMTSGRAPNAFARAVAYAAGGAVGALCGRSMRESEADRAGVEGGAHKADKEPDDARRAAVKLLDDIPTMAAVVGIATVLDADGSISGEEARSHMRSAGLL